MAAAIRIMLIASIICLLMHLAVGAPPSFAVGYGFRGLGYMKQRAGFLNRGTAWPQAGFIPYQIYG